MTPVWRRVPETLGLVVVFNAWLSQSLYQCCVSFDYVFKKIYCWLKYLNCQLSIWCANPWDPEPREVGPHGHAFERQEKLQKDGSWLQTILHTGRAHGSPLVRVTMAEGHMERGFRGRRHSLLDQLTLLLDSSERCRKTSGRSVSSVANRCTSRWWSFFDVWPFYHDHFWYDINATLTTICLRVEPPFFPRIVFDMSISLKVLTWNKCYSNSPEMAGFECPLSGWHQICYLIYQMGWWTYSTLHNMVCVANHILKKKEIVIMAFISGI